MNGTAQNVPVATERRRSRPNPIGGISHTYDEDETEFMMALERWKRDNLKPFPLFTDVLGVLKALGYVKKEDCQTELPSGASVLIQWDARREVWTGSLMVGDRTYNGESPNRLGLMHKLDLIFRAANRGEQ